MNFNILREDFLPGLQTVIGAVERRQSLPILSNLLINIENNSASLTATDLEVELQVAIEQPIESEGKITLPARKMLDICRALPEGAKLSFEVTNDKALIRSGRSRFTLATLPAQEYPATEMSESVTNFSIKQQILKTLLENTQFAMAQQDVRYYLNGLLLEIEKNKLRAVATDGHRLALYEVEIETDSKEPLQVIVPRKGISELTRLLQDSEEEAKIQISANHFRATIGKTRITSKLIDGRFPDYQRVIPVEDPKVLADREQLKQSLTRASILSNEKYRGVRILLQENCLRALAHNPEQEEAEEEIEVEYKGEEMEMGFNVSYLLDALSAVKTEKVRISVSDPNSSCLILPDDTSACKYVVMPMRL